MTSQGALLPQIYYGGRAAGRGVHEGNEEKWFRPKKVQRLETRDAKSRPDAAQKNFNPTGENRLPECLFI